MTDIVKGQRDLYGEKYRLYGDDPRTLCHNSEATQQLRFQILTDVFRHEHGEGFSVHEVGCGLAHLRSYLMTKRFPCEYSGSDVCEDLIEACRKKFTDCVFAVQDISAPIESQDAAIKGKDYYLLCGTFNTTGGAPQAQWENFVFQAVANMFALSRKGIAFNMLTSYSDFRADELYYADPREVYDWCKRRLSRFVSISSDSPLYEFTVFVYKKEFVRSLYPAEYDKYFRH